MTDEPDVHPWPHTGDDRDRLLDDLDDAIRRVLTDHATDDVPAVLRGWALVIDTETPDGWEWSASLAPTHQPSAYTAGMLLREGRVRL